MNEKEKLIPQRRFKEFKNTGTWEQRKLKDVAPLQRGFDLPKSEISEGPYPVLFSNGIGGWHSEYKAKAPGVITGRSGSIGNVVFIEQNYWPHNTSLWVTNFFDNCPRYVYYLYHHVDLSKFGTGSGVPTLNRNDVHDYSVIIPKPEEQSRIATFFKKLDDTIALHQRKLEKSKALKSAYLSEMFPSEGKSKPKRRFAGFTDDWEQRKLGETVQITMGQSPGGENYTENPKDYILVQGNADMKNGKVVPRVWTTQVTKKADPEDIILSVRAPVGDVGKTDYPVVLGRGVAGIKGNAFIFQTLSRMKEIGFWTRYSSGSTFESINSADLKDAVIQIPNIEEQIKIGEFFTKLDDTIALHQYKLEKLQNIKQAYLNELFV